ncbi:hypothetical protein EDB85DRAFT_1903112 [Lactarius pseudohatsudake]|nr:hypothetical protein EDB85DRAFT_1903112 [Lactarius pseudohatsudake]
MTHKHLQTRSSPYRNHAPKKEGAKKIFTQLNKTINIFLLSNWATWCKSYYGARKCGAGAVNAGALRPSSPAARHGGRRGRLGLVHPFPRERGATGLSACAARGQGEGWGRRWRALAGAARPSGKGRGQGRRGEGAACGPPPFRANAEGEVKGEGEGPRATGKEGAGGCVTSRAPFPRVRGGAVKGEGEGGGMRVGPGVACPRVRGGSVKGQAGGDGERGRRAPGKGEAGGSVPLCAPLRGRGGKGRGGGVTPSAGMGKDGGGVPSREWEGRGREERERAVAGCLHAHPFCANGRRGQGKSRGRRRGTGGKGVPSCAPFLRERGGADWGIRRGRHALVRSPFLRKKGWRTVREPILRPTHVSSPPSLSSPPNPLIRAKRGRRPKSLHRVQRGAHQDKGHTMPAAPRPPGPSLLPIRTTTFARKEGARGHAAAAASPVRGTPFARKGGARGLAPCPSSSYLAAPVRAGKGARDPPALPFPSRGRGAYGSTPPHHPASAPALPSWGVRGQTAPPLHVGPAPAPSLLSAPPHSRGVRACEGKNTRKGDTRGHATPRPLLPHSRGRGAREGTPPRLSASPPPSSPSLFAPPRSRGRGAHDTAPLSASPPPLSLPSSRRVRGQATPTCGAPFVREGVHEAKPTPPPSVSRSGAGRSQCARVHRARTAFSRAIPN